jgi:pimeloyl-ACP methyl ester carboxylesterase
MIADIAAQTPHTVVLRDGRTYAYYEHGDRDGTPCIYVTGTPTSGVIGAMWDDLAREAGVRWISVDKPGYGHSTLDPRYSLARSAADLGELLDALGIPSAAFVGESGGAPHVLATAHDLPDRVSAAFLVAGMGPGSEAWARKAMKPTNRQAMWMGKHAPFLLRTVMARIARMDQKTYAAWVLKEIPHADAEVLNRHPELLEYMYVGSRDAFRQGTRAAAQEMTMFAHPWHFAVDDVKVPVHLWHGTDDIHVPLAIAEEVIRRLPDSHPRIVQGKGHILAIEHREEILAAIVESAR